MMAALGYDVGSEYIAGLLGIYGNNDGVLELEGFKRLSQTETLEDATFREYDAGGKGHLTAAELSTLLKGLDYAVDAEYVAGLMEIYGGEGGVVELEAFRALAQQLGGDGLEEHELHRAGVAPAAAAAPKAEASASGGRVSPKPGQKPPTKV